MSSIQEQVTVKVREALHPHMVNDARAAAVGPVVRAVLAVFADPQFLVDAEDRITRRLQLLHESWDEPSNDEWNRELAKATVAEILAMFGFAAAGEVAR
jgi:hypothetical protein